MKNWNISTGHWRTSSRSRNAWKGKFIMFLLVLKHLQVGKSSRLSICLYLKNSPVSVNRDVSWHHEFRRFLSSRKTHIGPDKQRPNFITVMLIFFFFFLSHLRSLRSIIKAIICLGKKYCHKDRILIIKKHLCLHSSEYLPQYDLVVSQDWE